MDETRQFRQAALIYSLRQAAIFKGLPDEDVHRIASYCATESVAAGTYLFRQRDPVRGFFIVRKGLINVHRHTEDKREQIIHLLKAGESFAERALVSDLGYPANARAVSESEVIVIPTKSFKRHQLENPDLAWRMLSSMNAHLHMLVATIEGLKFRDIETRLVYWLLQRCPDPHSHEPIEIEIGTTKGALAEQLATRPETLSRILRRLRAAKLIFGSARIIGVTDPSALHALFEASRDRKNAERL